MYRLLATTVALLAGVDHASAQLNSLARAAGLLYFGTAVDNPGLTNAAYMRMASNVSEFGQITPANGQKWESTEATQGQFGFASGDAVTNIARQNGQFLRCHTLVWHSQLPSWGKTCSPRPRSPEVALPFAARRHCDVNAVYVLT